MSEFLTSAQMRATEAAAITSGTVPGLTLMERAGQAVRAAIFKQGPTPAFAVPAPRHCALRAGQHWPAIHLLLTSWRYAAAKPHRAHAPISCPKYPRRSHP